MFHLPDWDMWLRLMLADPGASHPEPHVAYVQHGSMLSHRHSDMLRRDVDLIEAKVRRHGLHRDHAVTDQAMLEWYAESHIACGRWVDVSRTYLTRAARYRGAGDLALAVGALGRHRGLALTRTALRSARAGRARLRGHADVETVEAPPPRPVWLDEVRTARV